MYCKLGVCVCVCVYVCAQYTIYMYIRIILESVLKSNVVGNHGYITIVVNFDIILRHQTCCYNNIHVRRVCL